MLTCETCPVVLVSYPEVIGCGLEKLKWHSVPCYQPSFTLPSLLAEGLCFMIYLPFVCSVHTGDGCLQAPRLPCWPRPHCTLRGTVIVWIPHSPPLLSAMEWELRSSYVSSSSQSSWALWIHEARWQVSDVWQTARSVWGLEDATATWRMWAETFPIIPSSRCSAIGLLGVNILKWVSRKPWI